MRGQVAARPVGICLGLQATLHPFITHASFQAVANLPLPEQVKRLRDPELRRRILAEECAPTFALLGSHFERLFELGDPPDYEPAPERSLAARAHAAGVPAEELAYDLLLKDDGRALLYRPVMNFSAGDCEVVREMLLHERAVPGLGDAGAHVGLISDGSFPTYLLTHWGRDRLRGERLPLEWLVRRHCADTAALVGLGDRGRIAPGLRADVNLVDWDALAVCPPAIAHDLPAGGRRLVQRARGWMKTLVAGEVVLEDGVPTGALPGRLVRGARPAPR